MLNPGRVRQLNRVSPAAAAGPLIYWMSRDQRVRDNWALLHARDLAMKARQPLAVVFCLAPSFLEATIRQYGFMLRGLAEVETGLSRLDIGFFLLAGDPAKQLPAFLRRQNAAAVVTDYSPLRINRKWKDEIAAAVRIPLLEVDAHNIVPVWAASPKQEYGAYTLRPKLNRLLPEYLEDFPVIRKHRYPWPEDLPLTDWKKAARNLKIDRSVAEVHDIDPGPAAAGRALRRFAAHGLDRYDELRNNPAINGQSGLSPYFHFGHLAPQRAALSVIEQDCDIRSQESFLEELIVRRELAENFCHYNQEYDSVAAFPEWGRKTLDEHRRDHREYIYGIEQLEYGKTHDRLWNAAQLEMTKHGKMHGYLRMYWAKKLLEWTRSPEAALQAAIRLNDRYSLDGRDPNGYAGIAWSIGGVHDRAWFERTVFGKIRYMNARGAARKFDIDAYIKYVERS